MATQRQIACTVLLAGLFAHASTAQQSWTKRAGVTSSTTDPDFDSGHASLSGDGRWVAFQSAATNLVPGDTSGLDDVFLHDLATGVTTRISVGLGGAQADSSSRFPRVSGDGLWIGFDSEATNLIVGDTNSCADVFMYDMTSGAITRVSVGPGGVQANDGSHNCSLSFDARFVAFESAANNLVPGDSNGATDVFVHDRATGTTQRVSVDSSGIEGDLISHLPALSANGDVIAFRSAATNLVLNDTNDCADIFVHVRSTGATTRVNLTTAGGEANWMGTTPSLSGDGRLVAFESQATNLVPNDVNGARDVFVHDRATGVTERVSVNSAGEPAVGVGSSYPVLSIDGRYVAFHSYSTNLVPGDTNDNADIFLRDLWLGRTTRESVDSNGAEVFGYSQFSALSADCRRIAFHSDAPLLINGDNNGVFDVFVHDRGDSLPTPFCVAGTSSNGCTATLSASGAPSASGATSFTVHANGAAGARAGLFFFGLDNTAFHPLPWGNQGSALCVKPPRLRTPLQTTGGTPGACDGALALNWNSLSVNPPLSAGQNVFVQAWLRDPPSSKATVLSNALWFQLGP